MLLEFYVEVTVYLCLQNMVQVQIISDGLLLLYLFSLFFFFGLGKGD